MVYKILLDTDIGDDIDDAFAIALAASRQDVEIVAITTVFKNTLARAKQTAQLVSVAGKDTIPVYFGEGMPLCGNIPLFDKDAGDPLTLLPCQYDETMDGLHVNADAVGAIISNAKKYSGDLIVVTIGAATNLAKAILRDPTIVKDIRKVVMMGGWFTNNQPEWNIICDPEAMDIVFKSGLDIYAVGLDVTLQCAMDKSLLQAFTSSDKPVNKLLTTWLNRWFDYFNFEKSVMHDPLALATVFNSEVCHFSEIYAQVQLIGDKRGAINVSDKYEQGYSHIYAADKVNTQLFYDIVKQQLL